MKNITSLLIATFFCNYILAQQLFYKGEAVDSIAISSNRSHYHFDRKGTTTGKSEEYTIVYSKEKNRYEAVSYTRSNYGITFSPSNERTKKLELPVKRIINQETVSNLIAGMNAYYVQPSFASSGITTQEFNTLTQEKSILKATKNKWLSEDELKDCQNIDTFNFFLSVSFDTSFFQMVTDYNESFHISVKSDSIWYNYTASYPHIYKQPWYGTNDIVNLSLNNIIVALLPRKFYIIETLKPANLLYSYFNWIIDGKE